MSFEDKSLVCSECGAAFSFTANEQDFYQSKGLVNEPKRCPSCRQARKASQGNSSYSNSGAGYHSDRQMYPAVCAECGKATQVPFEPHSDKPVYCSDCYRTVKATR
jgi:CxxC-x17-CxxC domain-containing protein